MIRSININPKTNQRTRTIIDIGKGSEANAEVGAEIEREIEAEAAVEKEIQLETEVGQETTDMVATMKTFTELSNLHVMTEIFRQNIKTMHQIEVQVLLDAKTQLMTPRIW